MSPQILQPIKAMKWTIEQIQTLSKRIYGNSNDENLLGKLSELHVHLKNYDESFLRMNNKHEWAEVERIAGEINQMLIDLHNKAIPPVRL
jgi:hypothetical protein